MTRIATIILALLFTACCSIDGWPDPIDLPDDGVDDEDAVDELDVGAPDLGAPDVGTPDPCAAALACAAMYVDSFAGDECAALEYCRPEWPDCIGWRLDELGCVP